MLSYILLFILITVVILGVARASQQARPRNIIPHKEPFVGTTREADDVVEMVGEPRIISHAHRPSIVMPMEDYPKENVGIVEPPSRISAPVQRETVAPLNTSNASPLFSVKPEQEVVAQKEPLNDLIVLHLIARPNAPYRGYELLQAMLAVGLRYGKWHIFHRHLDITGRGPILFSVASSVEPGTFDLAKMGSFSTAGLTLFMRPSNVENPTIGIEALWTAAQQLTLELGGAICDEKRVPFPTETWANWRAQHLEKIE